MKPRVRIEPGMSQNDVARASYHAWQHTDEGYAHFYAMLENAAGNDLPCPCRYCDDGPHNPAVPLETRVADWLAIEAGVARVPGRKGLVALD